MIFAALFDLTTMTIPNWLTAMLALLFLVAAAMTGMPLREIGLHTAVGFVSLLVGMGLFACGWIGGGDAKLMAVVAMWVGWAQALPYFLVASILGGALTLVILGYRNLPLPIFVMRHTWAMRLHERAEGVPYGIALATAALLIFPDTEIFRLTVAIS
jgi:prepilin peptidase CpaA